MSLPISLIGITGLKGSGKDTVFGFLKRSLREPEYGLRVKRDGFADRLKLSAYRCFKPDATLEEAIDWANWLKVEGDLSVYERGGSETLFVNGRNFLQNYGTEAHRDVFSKDFWISAVLPDVTDWSTLGRSDREDWDLLVVTDVRFDNEAAAVLRAGGRVWEVVREGLESDGHASERPLPRDLVSATIYNNGSLDDLRKNTLYLWGVVNGREAVNV